MELQALLVLCGAGVVGAAVLLLMGLFSASGTSYEEAIAQQRKAATELLSLAESKNKPKKNIKKLNKKLAKKEKKESAAAANSSEPESEAQADSGVDDEPTPTVRPHVEFSPPVVVDVPLDAPPTVKAVERKEEVIEKKDAKTKPGKGGKTAAKPAPAADEPAERRNSADVPKEQRKARKTEKKTSVSETVSSEVVVPLNAPVPSELTTDKLLRAALPPAATPSPPPGPKGKKKKNEPANMLSLMASDGGGVNVGELVRLVREAALSRTEIQILTDALLNKQHDPLPEHSEWTEGPNDPIQKLKKQLADKEKALADEVEASQALHAKLKELRATLNAERGRWAAGARALEAGEAAARAELHALTTRSQRLLDDNHALSQEILLLQSKLTDEHDFQAQRTQMEIHIQRLSESEASLVGQLTALQGELAARALEAGAVRDTLLMAQQQCAELAQQLQDANHAYSELEQQHQFTQQELLQAQERLAGSGELQAEVSRQQARASAAESAAAAAADDAERLRRDHHDLDKLNQQLSSEIASLKEQLSAREAELAEARQLRAPAQNGLPQPDHKAGELAAVEGVVEALRAELAAAARGARDQRDQLAALHDQLRSYQDKNNEAIAKAQEAQYLEVRSVLRAACPRAAPAAAPGAAWLHAFADNLKAELQAAAPVPVPAGPDHSARLADLQHQNEGLQALVDKYKRIIEDTEGVLSRLQQNVSTEEARWQQQLADKQRELDDLRASTLTQMQKKIDALQSEVSAARNHRDSFAAAERDTQERLMGTLSDKCKVDVSNGPLQVGLDEK